MGLTFYASEEIKKELLKEFAAEIDRLVKVGEHDCQHYYDCMAEIRASKMGEITVRNLNVLQTIIDELERGYLDK